jgi:hypothetical protein
MRLRCPRCKCRPRGLGKYRRCMICLAELRGIAIRQRDQLSALGGDAGHQARLRASGRRFDDR